PAFAVRASLQQEHCRQDRQRKCRRQDWRNTPPSPFRGLLSTFCHLSLPHAPLMAILLVAPLGGDADALGLLIILLAEGKYVVAGPEDVQVVAPLLHHRDPLAQ